MTWRKQGNKLTPNDINKLRAAFDGGVSVLDAADEVECTSRTVAKYYRIFRNFEPAPRGRPAIKPQEPRPMPSKSSRFYTSTFEL